MVHHHLHARRAHAQRRFTDARWHGFDRCAGRNNDGRQGHQGQHQTTDQRHRTGQTEQVDKDRQTQQTENNGRHGSQVVDIHFDEVGVTILWRKLFQIHRRRHTNREGQGQSDQHGKERTGHCRPDTGLLRLTGITLAEERGIPLNVGLTITLQRFYPRTGHFRQSRVLAIFGIGLDEHIDVIVGKNPLGLNGAEQIRIFLQLIAQQETGTGGRQLIQRAAFEAAFHVRETLAQCGLDQSVVVRVVNLIRITRVINTKLGRIPVNIQLDIGFNKCRGALADDVGKQHHHRQQAKCHRRDTKRTEALFRTVAGFQ